MSTFRMNDTVRSGVHDVGEQWTVDRHLYLTEDRSRVVEEGDAEARFLWAAPGRQVPMAQAILLGAVDGESADDAPAEDVEEAARAGVAADIEAQATHVVADEEEVPVEPEEKQAAQPENKMVAPEGDKARPDAKTVRAWAKDNNVDVPKTGRIPDDVLDAYTQAHQ